MFQYLGLNTSQWAKCFNTPNLYTANECKSKQIPGRKLSRFVGGKLISTCNRRVQSAAAGRVEISFQQAGIM